MQRSDFHCQHRLRVRWAEVDMQKIVFNGHYLAYVDVAMTEYWRALALPYEASMRALGGEMYVKKASLEYHASARMDDWLDIGLRCARVGNSSSVFEAGIFAGEKLLVSAEMLYVFADPATQTARSVPPALRAIFEGFEAGAEVSELRTGDWSMLGRDAARLRTEVFVREQGMAPEQEADAHDVPAVHGVVYNRLGLAVAAGRLQRQAQGVGRIERLAVTHGLRGSGLGRQLLDGLVALARARGDHQLVLTVPSSTQRFFERAGFRAWGPVGEGAGLPHVEMALALLPEVAGH